MVRICPSRAFFVSLKEKQLKLENEINSLKQNKEKQTINNLKIFFLICIQVLA